MDLKAENEKLRLQVYGQFGKVQTESMIQERVQSPTKRFVRALQRPENRCLGQNAFDFLKSLRDDLPTTTQQKTATNTCDAAAAVSASATADEHDKDNKENVEGIPIKSETS
jgi:hypothetical protein